MSEKLPIPYKDPTQYPHGYSLDLYCDHYILDDYNHNNAMCNFFGNSFVDCARQARVSGWRIHRATQTATCPKCLRLLKGAKNR